MLNAHDVRRRFTGTEGFKTGYYAHNHNISLISSDYNIDMQIILMEPQRSAELIINAPIIVETFY